MSITVLRSAAGMSLRAAKTAVGLMPVEMQRGLEQRTALVLNEGLTMLESKLKVHDPAQGAAPSGLHTDADIALSEDREALAKRLQVPPTPLFDRPILRTRTHARTGACTEVLHGDTAT